MFWKCDQKVTGVTPRYHISACLGCVWWKIS